MKRLVILFTAILLLVTGCSVTTLSNVDLGANVKTLLTEKAKLYNVYFEGYKYYVPKGLSFVSKEEYNAKFVDKFGNKYYLFVDAIGAYHQTDLNYELNEDLYYSRDFSYNNKDGYLQIEKRGDSYLVEFLFNYAKMEAVVSENDLVSAVDNMCYILRSVKYNKKILESLIGENNYNYNEESFSLFDDNTSSKEDFLNVVEEYDLNTSEEYNKSKNEEDKIDIKDKNE